MTSHFAKTSYWNTYRDYLVSTVDYFDGRRVYKRMKSSSRGQNEASGIFIDEVLRDLLQDSADVIHPDLSSIHNMFHQDDWTSHMGAYSFIDQIFDIKIGRLNRKVGLQMNPDINKPIVSVVNTNGVVLDIENDSMLMPIMIKEYSIFMKGVDKFNRLASYYVNPHKNIKWYRSFIIWLLEVSMRNSYILYKESLGDQALDRLAYRMAIIEEWSRSFTENPDTDYNGAGLTREECRLDKREEAVYRDCNYCSTRCRAEEDRRIRTRWYCVVCRQAVCPRCFIDHYKEMNP